MKQLFAFASATLLLAATAAGSPVLVALSFVVVFVGAGMSLYRIAQNTGRGKERRNFFLINYAGALAALVLGVGIMLYASSEAGELLAAFVTIVGLGWAAAATGALVGCAITHAAKKKREAQALPHVPNNCEERKGLED